MMISRVRTSRARVQDLKCKLKCEVSWACETDVLRRAFCRFPGVGAVADRRDSGGISRLLQQYLISDVNDGEGALENGHEGIDGDLRPVEG